MARACLSSPLPRENTGGGHRPAATPRGPHEKAVGWHLELGFQPPRTVSHKGLWSGPPGLWDFVRSAREVWTLRCLVASAELPPLLKPGCDGTGREVGGWGRWTPCHQLRRGGLGRRPLTHGRWGVHGTGHQGDPAQPPVVTS